MFVYEIVILLDEVWNEGRGCAKIGVVVCILLENKDIRIITYTHVFKYVGICHSCLWNENYKHISMEMKIENENYKYIYKQFLNVGNKLVEEELMSSLWHWWLSCQHSIWCHISYPTFLISPHSLTNRGTCASYWKASRRGKTSQSESWSKCRGLG